MLNIGVLGVQSTLHSGPTLRVSQAFFTVRVAKVTFEKVGSYGVNNMAKKQIQKNMLKYQAREIKTNPNTENKVTQTISDKHNMY